MIVHYLLLAEIGYILVMIPITCATLMEWVYRHNLDADLFLIGMDDGAITCIVVCLSFPSISY